MNWRRFKIDRTSDARHGASHLQFVGLDFLRFFAATLVVVYHFGFWHLLPIDATLVNAVPVDFASLAKAYTHFGWIGVELFFVISGFVIANSAFAAPSANAFAKGRILRLVPAVWICAPVTLIIYRALFGTSFSTLTFQFIRTVIFFPLFSTIDPVYWTLGIEISFYMLVYGLIRLRRLRLLTHVMICAGMVSLVFWATYLLLEQVAGQAVSETTHFYLHKMIAFRPFQLLLIQHGCFFAIGVLLWSASLPRSRDDGSARSIRDGVVFAGLIAACWLEIVGQNDIISRSAHMWLSPLPALTVWTVAIAIFAASVRFNDQIHRNLGAWHRATRSLYMMTYPLYLIHNPVGLLSAFLLLSLGCSGLVALGGACVAAFAIALAITLWPEPALRRVLDRGVRELQSNRTMVGAEPRI